MFDQGPDSSFSLSAVVFPHGEPQSNDRCDSSCTPGSLGVVRGGQSLCRPAQSQCDQQVSIANMTDKLCEAWARIFPFLRSSGHGRQILQDPAKGSWLACSVFCETVSGTWYSPRTELSHFYLSAALPEGTLCHSSEEEDYYCQVTLNTQGRGSYLVAWLQDTLCLPILDGKDGHVQR